MNAFFHWFVLVLTVLSIIGCLWLLFSQRKGVPGESTTGHVWDGDLREYNNPLPRWWLNMFVLTALFGAGYLLLYPGLGNWSGERGWSSRQEMEQRLAELTASRTEAYARLSGMGLDTLSADAGALKLGRSVFLANCAGCHGPDARGARGFPDLADGDWLYGHDDTALITSITQGRHGQMPAFNGMLSPQALDALLDFIPYWSDPTLKPERREAGMKAFTGICSACHGPDGKGNVALGAPDLTDDVWLWGGNRNAVRDSILFGRSGNMPAHRDLLTEDEIRVVAGYVRSLARETTP